jgi:hypothetical protein
MIGWILPAGTVLAAAVLAVGYGLHGMWQGAAVALATGVLWLVGQRRRWKRVAAVALVIWVGAAAIGLEMGVGGGWMLVGVVAALVAWDLDHFAWRMRVVGRVQDADVLARRHLRRSLAVAALGLFLGAAALSLRIRLGFAVAFLLALLALVGLSRVVGFLRYQGD